MIHHWLKSNEEIIMMNINELPPLRRENLMPLERIDAKVVLKEDEGQKCFIDNDAIEEDFVWSNNDIEEEFHSTNDVNEEDNSIEDDFDSN
ncbi:hypothetical protein LguiB_027784 [Lonicera macranthoides]